MKPWKQWLAPDRRITQSPNITRQELARLLYAKAHMEQRLEQERAAWARKAYEEDAEGSAAHAVAVQRLEQHREALAQNIVETRSLFELEQRERQESRDARLLKKVVTPELRARREKLEEQRLQRLAEVELEAELALES